MGGDGQDVGRLRYWPGEGSGVIFVGRQQMLAAFLLVISSFKIFL